MQYGSHFEAGSLAERYMRGMYSMIRKLIVLTVSKLEFRMNQETGRHCTKQLQLEMTVECRFFSSAMWIAWPRNLIRATHRYTRRLAEALVAAWNWSVLRPAPSRSRSRRVDSRRGWPILLKPSTVIHWILSTTKDSPHFIWLLRMDTIKVPGNC